jgi:hypothetical protein
VEHRLVLVGAGAVDHLYERLLLDGRPRPLGLERAACGGVQGRGLPALVLGVGCGQRPVDLFQGGLEFLSPGGTATGVGDRAQQREHDQRRDHRDDDCRER